MDAPELYILRHGETEWKVAGRIQGNLDSPLTGRGRLQAEAQGRILRGQDLAGFDALVSPQGRALATAEIALGDLLGSVTQDPRLVEIGVGAWTGLSREEIRITGMLDESEENAFALYERAPDGEGFAALHARCSDFLQSLSGPAVIVTHGMTSRMLRTILTGRSVLELADVGGGQGIVYRLKDGQQWKLT